MAEGICVIGIFDVEKGKIKKKKLFPKDAEKIAKELTNIEKYDKKASEYLNKNIRKIAKDFKYVKNDAELNSLISKVYTIMTKNKISKTQRRDRLISQSVSAYSDLDKIINSMSERIREWYGLYYPELKVSGHEKYIDLILQYKSREKFRNYTQSMGINLTKKDLDVIIEYAKELKHLFDIRKRIQKYLEEIVPEVMPNTSALLGPILAARLLAHAGTLEKLAKMPSSKLQLLGSEKSLFKFMKGKQKKVPKYGLIAIHPDISTAKKEKKGKIARLLAAKLTLAVRADYYSKKDISKKILKEYKEKLKEI
ncbi:MAG: NOP58 family protein [Candidatus Aenigmarchaeota archaeon]|nr:NOP58 family protein [Candidatus Aenigmarchaeota archaeon]